MARKTRKGTTWQRTIEIVNSKKFNIIDEILNNTSLSISQILTLSNEVTHIIRNNNQFDFKLHNKKIKLSISSLHDIKEKKTNTFPDYGIKKKSKITNKLVITGYKKIISTFTVL